MKKLVITLGLTILITSTARSAAPQLINFQGLLTDTAGTPLADGNYNVLFIIYDAASGGNQIWNESRSVSLVDGLFTIDLGAVNPLDQSVFDTSPLYLAMQVGANPEMSPRSLLVSVPWSIQSSKADYADEAAHATTTDTAGFALTSPGAGGNVFIRWGNSTAPAGTDLLYWGYAFGPHYTFAAPGDLIVVNSSSPGDSISAQGSLLYPAEMETVGTPLSAFIPQDSKLKAAVCFSNSPTATIWGTDTPPVGWSALYTGYAMASHYTHGAPAGTYCVDHLNFESVTFGNQNGPLLFPSKSWTSGYGVEAGLNSRLIKCVVCKKD
jgi:hypothetical protein